jgi:hypothetical protein
MGAGHLENESTLEPKAQRHVMQVGRTLAVNEVAGPAIHAACGDQLLRCPGDRIRAGAADTFPNPGRSPLLREQVSAQSTEPPYTAIAPLSDDPAVSLPAIAS